MAKPIVDGIEKDLAGRATMIRLDVTKNVGQRIASRYQVRVLPTLLILDEQGHIRQMYEGLPDRQQINEWFK